MDGVRRGQLRLLDDFSWLDHLVHFGLLGIRRINDVDPAADQSRHNQISPLFLAVATAAGVPAKVVQFITDVGHWQVVHDLAILRLSESRSTLAKKSGCSTLVP